MSQYAEQYARLGMSIPETADPVQKSELIYIAACEKLGTNPLSLPDVSRLREKYQAKPVADYKLMIIRDALTEEREADWNDRSERKYDGWFLMNNPGFRFGDSYYGFSATGAAGGSRLCTFSEEDQEFFMTEPIALWAASMGGKLPA